MPLVDGIHQYVEGDNTPLFSETLNLLGDSVRNRLRYFSGPDADRLELIPAPGMMWQDTDGTKRLWSVSPAGAWRQHEGKLTFAAAAWDVSAAPAYGRTISATFPTVLAAHESLEITLIDVPGIWATVTLGALTKGASNTTAAIYLARLFNATTMGATVTWRIIDTGA